MGLAELVFRGRQEASKWLDRTAAIGPRGTRAEGELDLARFREVAPGRFFEGAADARVPGLLAARAPSARDEILVSAGDVCGGRFDLLGYSRLVFGNPVDWHLDPISGRRAPLVHWSRLDPLDSATVGDSKVVWELNRHQWLIRLGQAYRLTGDERYAGAFAAYVRQWLRANPPGMGINWASSLEVALRLIAWCWGLVLFSESPVLSPELFAAMLDALSAHAAHVERYLSRYFSPNTHLTGEALGLFYAGAVLQELRHAERWRTVGARILVDECERQILSDGVYFERATGYQRYTLEIYLHFLILAGRNAWPVPPAIAERAGKMLDFMLAVRFPDGSVPLIGDADSGSLAPLARRRQDDVRGVLSTAAALFARADCAWAVGSPAPEVLWLLGPRGLEALDTLRPAPPASPPSQLFGDGGYVVMRSGWEPDAHQVVFDVGALGCPVSGGHGHADMLSIQCAAFGDPYLVDAGTYCYTADAEWRDYFRSSAAHSTVVVDGEPQAVPAGVFRWRARPRARLRSWRSTPRFDFADAAHHGYRRLSDPVVHRRRVVFARAGYWLLVDDLEGAAEHRVELRFQFRPMEVEVDPTLWARARGANGRELLVRPFSAAPLKARVCEGDLVPIQGWVSPEYGQRRPAPALIYSTVTSLPLRIVTLFLPAARPIASPPVVTPLFDEHDTPVGLVFEDDDEHIRFADSIPLASDREGRA
jgi:uncharacterized heparinase superfamily protein